MLFTTMKQESANHISGIFYILLGTFYDKYEAENVQIKYKIFNMYCTV